MIPSELATTCGLCSLRAKEPYEIAFGRQFLRCTNCQLISLEPSLRLSFHKEQSRYELHQNDSNNSEYRKHLSKAINPLIEVLEKGARGLDFGCGPNPTASIMLENGGFEMRNYDPFFIPDEGALQNTYDFIICTEAAEHFFTPRKEFELLHKITRPRGWLAIMTQLFDPSQSFATWWYTRDPTHVSIYTKESLKWIADTWGWDIIRSSDGVHLLRK